MISREDEQLAANSRFVERLVEHTEQRLWIKQRPLGPGIHCNSNSAPGTGMGCLNVVYIAKTMPIDEAARRYLPAMQAVLEKIKAQWI